MDDFENAFNEAVAEVEADPTIGDDAVLPPQATIHTGDDESPAGESDELNDEEGDEPDEGAEDESSETADESDNSDPFDLEAHKDQLVTVKVNGEDVEVPLGEAVAGFMRQQDYTRKTQEIAGMRRAVEAAAQMRQALEQDPHGTLAALANAYGVELAPSTEASGDDPYATDDPELAPILQRQKAADERVRQLEQQLQAQQAAAEERAVLAEVRAELAQVKAQYGEFDPAEVLPLAAEKNISIEDAFLIVEARKAKVAKAGAAKTAETAVAKRKVANTAKGASRVATAKVTEPEFDSFEDMLSAALVG